MHLSSDSAATNSNYR